MVRCARVEGTTRCPCRTRRCVNKPQVCDALSDSCSGSVVVISSGRQRPTQDIALRTWLVSQGFTVDEDGGGDVVIRAQENAQTLSEFQAGRIAGAWVPEPWASRLVLEGGGTVLVDERDLWPDGRFVTTHLVVRTEYLRDHPQTVEALLRGQLAANEQIAADPGTAKQVLNEQLEELTGKALQPQTIDRAFASIEVTEDPVASSLRASAEHAFATGLVEQADLTGIYDLTLLRKVLGSDVDDAGLGARPARRAERHDAAPARHRPPGGAAAAGPAPAVRVDHVSKRFGDGPLVLDDVSLQVAPGEFVCLLGASGCGKSTLLNVVAGLDRPSAGTAEVPGGRAALMFQEPALFPWLTAVGQRRARAAPARRRAQERRDRAQELLALVGCRTPAASGRTSCPAACGSGSRWPAPWRRTATCC
jgi:hypothetical protein